MQTTQDIIKILPFKDEFKSELLKNFDAYTPDQKYAVERVIWDFYDALYETRLDQNMQEAMNRAKKNEENLDHEFYERVRKQTDQQLQQEFSQTAANVDLTSTREKLEKILQQSS